MGYGDYIMLTALAANARKNNKRISFYYLTSRKKKVQKKNLAKIEILHNNPDVEEILIESRVKFCIRRLKRFLAGKKDYVYFPLRRFTRAYMDVLSKREYRFKLNNRHLHAVEAFCKFGGIKFHSTAPKVFLTPEEETKGDLILQENGIKNKPYIIIETSTLLKNSTKGWKLEYWKELIELVQRNYPGLEIIQISPGQSHFDHVKDISGKTSFRESLYFVKNAKAVISSEGALIHSAAVYNTPCVVIVPRSISLNLSYCPSQKRVFYNQELDCAECGYLANCPKKNLCMDSISPDEVFKAFRELDIDMTV
jgi:ADP-heptose:LPS heptosyltransferase